MAEVEVVDTEKLLANSSKKGGKGGGLSFKERQQHFQERKEELAKREETRVVYARTQDIRGLVNVISIGDVALRRLRDGLGIRYDVNQAAEKISDFNKASKDLIKVIADITAMVGIDFKLPKWAQDEEESKSSPKVSI